MLYDLTHPWSNNLMVLLDGKVEGACIAACPLEGWILRYQYDVLEDGRILLKTTPWVDTPTGGKKREILDPVFVYGNVRVMTKEGQLCLF
jgi:hypothetical protein